MLATLTAWLSSLAGQAFKALFGAGVDAVDHAAARADEQQLGQARQKASDQGAALDAAKRMNGAGAAPRGRSVTQKELDDGTF